MERLVFLVLLALSMIYLVSTGFNEKVLYYFVAIILLGIIRYAIGLKVYVDQYYSKIMTVTIIAIFMRSAASIILLDTGFSRFFAPDSLYYNGAGWDIAVRWLDLLQDYAGAGVERHYNLYHYICASLYYFVGQEPILPTLINAFLGGLMVPMVYSLCVNIGFTRKNAYHGALFTAFWPSLVLWSSIQIRDVWMQIIILMALTQWTSFMRGKGKSGLVWVFFCCVAMFFLRPYIVPLFLAAVLLASIIARSRNKKVTTFVVLAGIFLVLQLDSVLGFSMMQTIDKVQTTRQGFHGVGSSFGEDVKLTDMGSVMGFMPIAMLYFLFAPFPWELTSALQASTLLEVLIFYGCFYFLVLGMTKHLKENPAYALPTVLLVVLISTTYALVEGNVGTIYRHKAQILPYLLMFIPVGWEHFKKRRKH